MSVPDAPSSRPVGDDIQARVSGDAFLDTPFPSTVTLIERLKRLFCFLFGDLRELRRSLRYGPEEWIHRGGIIDERHHKTAGTLKNTDGWVFFDFDDDRTIPMAWRPILRSALKRGQQDLLERTLRGQGDTARNPDGTPYRGVPGGLKNGSGS